MFAALRKSRARLGGTLLLLALLATYANHFQNSFHFDDAHTIENNFSIQSLGNIPRFFTDATTFSSMPSNQSYRPLLSTLFAIDYRLGGGLKPIWFHASIFAFFLVLVLMLVLLLEHLLNQEGNSPANVWIGLGTAALYGLHPANADTVNYISASSDLISTLGIIASFTLYLGFPNLRRSYFYVLPAAVTILAKPVGAIFPLLVAVYLILFSDGPKGRGYKTTISRLREVIPLFLICAAVLLLVQAMTPRAWESGARDAHSYLMTQPYVALLYFKTFFWPNDLSADYDLNPLTSISDPRFWAGTVFVGAFLAIAIVAARSKRTRVIGFGLLWFLICLSPTSLYPLAEVMNDHRTFLAYIGLVIALAGVAALLLRTRIAGPQPVRIASVAIILFILSVSAFATFQRNKAWKTEGTLWRDVAIKSPKNPRGLMNYGNTLMAKGDFNGALDYFHRALPLAPQYSLLFINLAIAEDATNQRALAERHFKEALRLAPSSPDSYTFYARYLVANARPQEADTLLRTALALSPTDVSAHELLVQIHQPQTAESYLLLSLRLYQAGRYEETIAACQNALKLKPDYAEAWNNMCAADNKLGRYDEAAAACESALRYRPDFELARNNLEYARKAK